METVFQAAGMRAAVLEGNVTNKDRKNIMDLFESGAVQVLVTCKMVLQGVDIPMLLMSVDLAPTLSRMIWRQKVGRVARTYEGKTRGIYLDLVGNIVRATKSGWVYEEIDWRFDSETYNKRTKSLEAADMYCPMCFAYIPPPGTVCPECGATKSDEGRKQKEKEEAKLEGDLVEAKPVPLKDRPIEEQRDFIEAVRSAVKDQDIERLKEIGSAIVTAKKLPFWIYHKMNTKKNIVDIPLLYRIQRSFGYPSGWVWFAKKHCRPGDRIR
jgi:superfamily II DNA/RNA helicase